MARDPSQFKTRRPGRPNRVLEPELIDEICESVELGVPGSLIALGIGVAPNTITKWLAEEDEFRALYQAARYRGIKNKLREMDACVQREGQDWKEIAWRLSRMYPEEFANPEKAAQVAITNSVSISTYF